MDYYNAVASTTIALLSSMVLGLTLKWFGHHLTARDVQRDLQESEHDALINCQFELRLERHHNDNLEAALKQFCERYQETKTIEQRDIDTILLEIQQRPKTSGAI